MVLDDKFHFKVIDGIETKDVDGLEKFLGEYVQLWCMNYIYAGRLVGVNEKDCVLENPHVVYETGKMSSSEEFKFIESCGVDEVFVRIDAIESYSLAPKMVDQK